LQLAGSPREAAALRRTYENSQFLPAVTHLNSK
jgi:hypothetical protein